MLGQDGRRTQRRDTAPLPLGPGLGFDLFDQLGREAALLLHRKMAPAWKRFQSSFGEFLDRVATVGAVAITRHDTPKAVLLSYEEFQSLSNARSETLDALSAKFEGLLERLQTPVASSGLEAAFNATPEELGQAAVEAARRRP